MAGIWDWSSTPSSNTTLDSINVNTGMSPANVDNAIRSAMALIRASFSSALQNFLGGTAALPVANGGTGGADAATARTNLGALSDAYRDLVRFDHSGDFTLSNSERGGGLALASTSPETLTINPNSSTAYTQGGVWTLYNSGTSNWTITPGSGVTLRKNGATSSASATLAPGGQASLVNWTTDYFVINGVGVS